MMRSGTTRRDTSGFESRAHRHSTTHTNFSERSAPRVNPISYQRDPPRPPWTMTNRRNARPPPSSGEDDYGVYGSQPMPFPSASSLLGSGGRTVKLRSLVMAHG